MDWTKEPKYIPVYMCIRIGDVINIAFYISRERWFI